MVMKTPAGCCQGKPPNSDHELGRRQQLRKRTCWNSRFRTVNGGGAARRPVPGARAGRSRRCHRAASTLRSPPAPPSHTHSRPRHCAPGEEGGGWGTEPGRLCRQQRTLPLQIDAAQPCNTRRVLLQPLQTTHVAFHAPRVVYTANECRWLPQVNAGGSHSLPCLTHGVSSIDSMRWIPQMNAGGYRK